MIFGLAVLFVLVILPVFIISPKVENDTLIENRNDWLIYESNELGIYFEYPPDWSVSETDSPVPAVHILPSDISTEGVDNITHHTDITNVSVFPLGYPSESVLGQSRYSSKDYFPKRKEETVDFYLVNGDVWGTMINLEFIPKGWNTNGFIWSRTAISDHKTLCFDGEKEVPKTNCDPFMGDVIKHEGFINSSERLIQEEILRSINF